ncbi:MAG: shikimate dehydrogenase [Bacteroidetes bacterium]|nr:shikimate dehydrogenase [Bacteroidota bacterium]
MKQFGLIGYPLSHSFSKKYFTEKFEKENIPGCEYNTYPIENIELFPKLIADNLSLCGLNVTIPYKESVIQFLDELDETAKAVGAVNCIKVESRKSEIGSADNTQLPKPKLIGYNTDVFGFRQSIKPFLETQHERALILGTGGASKAVAYVLKEIGIDCYFVRRKKTEDRIQKTFLYSELNENVIKAFKLIVNTTPVGMYPNVNDAPEIPYNFITSSHLLYDLVYNPIETEFLKRGKQQGASTVNGLSMLHQQAEEAWKIWNK